MAHYCQQVFFQQIFLYGLVTRRFVVTIILIHEFESGHQTIILPSIPKCANHKGVLQMSYSRRPSPTQNANYNGIRDFYCENINYILNIHL